MTEDFNPFPWDPGKIRADTIDLSKIRADTIDLSKITTVHLDATDLVPDPEFPWLLTTRQDQGSGRQTTTASSTDSGSPSSDQANSNSRQGRQWSHRSRKQPAGVSRRLRDFLKRAVGSSGY